MKGMAVCCTMALGLVLGTAATSQAGYWYPGSYVPVHYHHHYCARGRSCARAGLRIRGLSRLSAGRGPLPGHGARAGGCSRAILLRCSWGCPRLPRTRVWNPRRFLTSHPR